MLYEVHFGSSRIPMDIRVLDTEVLESDQDWVYTVTILVGFYLCISGLHHSVMDSPPLLGSSLRYARLERTRVTFFDGQNTRVGSRGRREREGDNDNGSKRGRRLNGKEGKMYDESANFRQWRRRDSLYSSKLAYNLGHYYLTQRRHKLSCLMFGTPVRRMLIFWR